RYRNGSQEAVLILIATRALLDADLADELHAGEIAVASDNALGLGLFTHVVRLDLAGRLQNAAQRRAGNVAGLRVAILVSLAARNDHVLPELAVLERAARHRELAVRIGDIGRVGGGFPSAFTDRARADRHDEG